jgi:ferredoxin-NADP reductase
VTPIRALLEELPAGTDTTVVVRASDRSELVLHHELASLVRSRGGVLHEVIGPRQLARLDEAALRRLVPDISQRDVFVCGPDGFSEQLLATARRLGVPDERLHRETFAF